MSDYEGNQGAAQARVAGAQLGGDMLDLLIRNLEVARANYNEGELGLTDGHPTLCTLWYAEPGTLCPLLYFHLPAVEEAKPVV